MIRTENDFQKVYEESQQEEVDSIIDQHYNAIGLESLDAEWLRGTYEDAEIMDSDDDYLFLIPRQQPTSTVEQISMAEVASMLGDNLQEEGEIQDYSVVGAPLTDKMYGRNSEKRGYAMPVVSTEEGLWETQVADIQDGYSVGSHEISFRDNSEHVVEEILGGQTGVNNLRELHDGFETPIVHTRGDFTEVQRNMIQEMINHGQEPEILGVEDYDGKVTGVKYNPETHRYESLDDRRDIELSLDEAVDEGILRPEMNYETLVFPSAVHSEIGYMLRGLENDKFQTENTEELEREVRENGLSRFPFIDISSGENYRTVVPSEELERLQDTSFGSSSSLKKNGMVLNVYPSKQDNKKIWS